MCEHCERQPNGRMKYCSPECKEEAWAMQRAKLKKYRRQNYLYETNPLTK